jgi:hypothetical protein
MAYSNCWPELFKGGAAVAAAAAAAVLVVSVSDMHHPMTLANFSRDHVTLNRIFLQKSHKT